jgi:ParB-like chromosome segregation protein Spo0J
VTSHMDAAAGGAASGRVRIAAIQRGDSPRSGGEVAEHIQVLAESAGPLPPILVHRSTLRVIDGMHRLGAAILRGEDTIDVTFFDGDDGEAFVAAVKANIAHGMPLSLPDREAAAERLLARYPERSDRWIADVAGLSPGTIAAIRARVTTDGAEALARIGRDGKVRPLNSTDARRFASEIILDQPDASLRKVARICGLSPATVLDVRERLHRGEDPVPRRERIRREGPASAGRRDRRPVRRDQHRDVETLLAILNRDPALRFNESGRVLLRWLSGAGRSAQNWRRIADSIPPHCAYLVAELAQRCAEELSSFADNLEREVSETG